MLFVAFALAVIGGIGWGGRTARIMLLWGNVKKVDALQDQMEGLQGYCRFMFWIGLVGGGIQITITLVSALLHKI